MKFLTSSAHGSLDVDTQKKKKKKTTKTGMMMF